MHCTVEVANDGRGAPDIARWFEPEVVLPDIGMPDMGGNQISLIPLTAGVDTQWLRLAGLTGLLSREARAGHAAQGEEQGTHARGVRARTARASR